MRATVDQHPPVMTSLSQRRAAQLTDRPAELSASLPHQQIGHIFFIQLYK